jgi:hypothetical protein
MEQLLMMRVEYLLVMCGYQLLGLWDVAACDHEGLISFWS